MFCNYIWIIILNQLSRRDLVKLFSTSKKIKSLCIRVLQLQLSLRQPGRKTDNIKDLQLSSRSKVVLPDNIEYASSRLFIVNTYENYICEITSLDNIVRCFGLDKNKIILITYDKYLHLFFKDTNTIKKLCSIAENKFEIQDILDIEKCYDETYLTFGIIYENREVRFYFDNTSYELKNIEIDYGDNEEIALFYISDNNLIRKDNNTIVLENVISFYGGYYVDYYIGEGFIKVYFKDKKLIKYSIGENLQLNINMIFYNVSKYSDFYEIVYENGICENKNLEKYFEDKFIRRITYIHRYYFVWTL